MDPDAGGYFNSSMLFKASILTVSFTAFYYYRTEKQLSFLKKPVVRVTDAAEKPAVKKAIKKKKKTIYLTFDDGPDRGTKNLLAIMNTEQVPVTVFIIGQHVYGSSSQQSIFDSVSQSGYFEIANHSYTHGFENRFRSFYNSPDSAVKDFERCADSLRLSGRIIRTPGRNIWRTDAVSSTDLSGSAAAADSLYRRGFTAIGWDAEWHFDREQRLVQSDSEMVKLVDSLFNHRKTKTEGHLVLLAHDRNFITADDSAGLHRFIAALKQKNEYEFETVSRYPGLTKDTVTSK